MRFISPILLLVLLCSCQKEPTDKYLIHHTKVPAVRLFPDSTWLKVSDFMSKGIPLDSIYSESDIQIQKIDDNILIVNQEEEDWIGAMRFVSGDSILDVPLYFPTQRKWKYFFPDPAKKFSEVYLVGDVNNWDRRATPLKYIEGNWQTEMWLLPGKYGYQLMIDDSLRLDPYNEKSIPNGIGGYNSLIEMEGASDEQRPKIYFQGKEDHLIIHSNDLNGQYLAFWNNLILPIQEKSGRVSIEVPEMAKSYKRSYIRVYAQNKFARSNDLLIPLDSGKIIADAGQLNRSDIHGMRLYFLMVDRFYNGNPENDQPTEDPDILPIANFMGGDLTGVQKKLSEGYFDSLHMNAIWLSPIPKNPEGAFGLWDKGGVRSEFSAYHGYWPISFTEIDARFGSKEALHELVDSAHEMDKNVILDFVANHVHELHPVYQKHKNEGWATDLYLPDGSLNTEKWDEHRLTTWFDTFLPTLNLEKEEITEMLSDSAMYWLQEYNIDGFRHDATKHIPLNFWRTLTDKVRTYESEKGTEVFQIGETYGTAELIGSYLGYGLLDAQFDFNMYDALVQAIVTEEGDFSELADQIDESLRFYGHHHLMGNMSGNQDKTRFMSLATGEVRTDEDSKLAGWTRDIQEQTDEGFAKLSMMHAFNFALPGIPVVYYGDEIGMPGGNDPDNRRMMRFENISEEEKEMRKRTAHLAELRAQLLPLQYGSTEILISGKDLLVISRTYGNEAVIVAFNKGSDKFIELDIPFQVKGEFEGHFLGNAQLQGSQLAFELPGNSYEFISLKNIQYENE